MKTFYLAGPSERHEELAPLAGGLEELGWECLCKWWYDVPKFGASGLNNSDALQQAGMVCSDISAVTACELFVAVVTDAPASRGMYMEIGARIASGRRTHVVLQGGPRHLFFSHPLVKVHQTWRLFLDWILEHRARVLR